MAIACPEIELVWSTDLTKGKGAGARKRRFPSEFDAGMELGRQVVNFLFDWQGGEFIEQGDLFVAERPFAGSRVMNIRTAIGQSLSAGALLATLPGRVILLDSPSMWKKALCGNGDADKPAIRRWVEGRHPALAEACGEVEDRFDAVGIALGGAALAQAGDL